MLFYSLFSLGHVLVAVVPNADASGWPKALTSAALFGFLTYMTYDLTNLATFRGGQLASPCSTSHGANWSASVLLLAAGWP